MLIASRGIGDLRNKIDMTYRLPDRGQSFNDCLHNIVRIL
ncbi:hypothetical protein BN1088_860002 [Sphingobacterium sp. PM2-P1-29]|nr:hypothetical protein BN1088_860002 [Sphingobacterium sp. PM2-P1-29]